MFPFSSGGATGFDLSLSSNGAHATWAEFVFILVFAACAALDVLQFWRAATRARVLRASCACAAVCVLAGWWHYAADQLYLARLHFHLLYVLAAMFELPGLMLAAAAPGPPLARCPLAFCYALAATFLQPNRWWYSLILAGAPLAVWALAHGYVPWGTRRRKRAD